MNSIHVIMPFSRKHLKNELLALYKDVVLHPITLPDQTIEWGNDNVIPFVVPSCKENICYYKLNQFIKTQEIIDEDYYWCMCDDDSIENNVIPAIKEMNDDVIFISMKRGQFMPEGIAAHPINILYAEPENVRVCQIGLEQMIVKGKIFKTLSFRTDYEYADGEMAIYLKENYTIHYEPNLFAKFNFFEPDRWVK